MTDLLSKERLEYLGARRGFSVTISGSELADLIDEYKALEKKLSDYEKAAKSPVAWMDKKQNICSINQRADPRLSEALKGFTNPLFAGPTLTSAEREKLAAYDKASKSPVAWLVGGVVQYNPVTIEKFGEASGLPVHPLYTEPQIPLAQDEPQPASVDPRDEFEKQFPMPRYVERCGSGYGVTAFDDCDANTFIDNWDGWESCLTHVSSKKTSAPGIPEGGCDTDKTHDNRRNGTRYAVVWNKGKIEGVVFNCDRQSHDVVMNDIMCAGGGDCFSPYSTLAESFCEHYGYGECTYQLIEIDTSDEKLTSIAKSGEYDDDV